MCQGEEYYIIQYLDVRYEGTWFNKMRVFFIDGQIFPVVSHVDNVWNVHGDNRLEIMKKYAWMQTQEKAFLTDPAARIGKENLARLQGLYEIVGLDFFGVDFCLQDDDTILIYELNAAMRHNFDHAKEFDYMTPHMEVISNAFLSMVKARL